MAPGVASRPSQCGADFLASDEKRLWKWKLLILIVVGISLKMAVTAGLAAVHKCGDTSSRLPVLMENGTSLNAGVKESLWERIVHERGQCSVNTPPEKIFLEMMDSSQHPQDCRTARVLVIQCSKFRQGLAAMLQWLSGALTYAFIHKRTVVFADPDDWIWAPNCDGKSFECYFKPFSNCTEADVWPSRQEVLVRRGRDDERVLYFDPGALETIGALRELSWTQVLSCRHWWPYAWCRYWYTVPAPFAQRGLSLRWWKAQVAAYIFRPRAEIEEMARAVELRMGWNATGSRKVCMHIRRGDKVRGALAEAPFIVPLMDFADTAARLVRMYAVNTVFIATDEAFIIAEMNRLLGEESKRLGVQVRVMYDAEEERNQGANYRKIADGSLKDVQLEMRTAAVNLHLLSQCEFLVGTFTSWFSKYAALLKYARGYPHAISMDVPLFFWQP